MYTLKSAYARPEGVGNRLATVDISVLLATPLTNIARDYRDLHLILQGPTDPTKDLLFNYSRDVYDFFPAGGTTGVTLQDWFTGLGNTALPYTIVEKLQTDIAVVADAWMAEFHVNTTQSGARPNDSVPPSARRDLLLTHKTVLPKTVYDNCLVSVCGYLHYTDYSDWGLYVKEGGITSSTSRKNTCSLISMAVLGGVKMIPITESMITGLPEDGGMLKGSIYLNTPGVDWSDKTAMLSLGGKLLPLGKTFRSNGPGEFELDLLNFPYAQHYMEALKVIDLSSMQAVMPSRATNDSMVAVEGLYSAAAIKAYLMLSQSFIIAVNSPGVFVESEHVWTTHNPGVFITEILPTGLLVSNTNRILDYLIKKERDRYALHTLPDLSERRMFWNTDWRNQAGIDNKRPTVRPFDPVQARMLSIGRDIFV